MLSAGSGNNTIVGGAGDDSLGAGNGTNTISGGTGNDTIVAGSGANTIDGGDGNDKVYAGVYGTLAQQISGGAGDDYLSGGGGADVMNGGSGNDTYVVTAGDRISDSSGIDTVRHRADDLRHDAVSNCRESLRHRRPRRHDNRQQSRQRDHRRQRLHLAHCRWRQRRRPYRRRRLPRHADRGAGDDHLAGLKLDDVLNGSGGKDVLEGGDGNDKLDGGGDGDRLNGGDQDDTIHGGTGDDVVDGDSTAIDPGVATSGSGKVSKARQQRRDHRDRAQPGRATTASRPIPTSSTSTVLPHVTVNATLNDSPADFYAITVAHPGEKVTVDVDTLGKGASVRDQRQHLRRRRHDRRQQRVQLRHRRPGRRRLDRDQRHLYRVHRAKAGTYTIEIYSNFPGFVDNSYTLNVSLGSLAGDDVLFGDGGKDTLNGGRGDDVLDGGSGDDKLDGGDGIDTASYAARPRRSRWRSRRARRTPAARAPTRSSISRI